MRFEHILQVYWSKGFFFGGKLFYTNKLLFNEIFKNNLYGFNSKLKLLLIQRFELTTFFMYYTNLFYLINYSTRFHKKLTKTLNIIFSQINNVNTNLFELKKLNIIKKYLIRSYQGYCHAIGKPVRGQRTWSNAWNSFKCNNILRNFINKIKFLKSLSSNQRNTKNNYKVILKKYTNSKALENTLSKKNKNSSIIVKNPWY